MSLSPRKIVKLMLFSPPSIVMHVLKIGKVDSETQAERLTICAECPSKLAQPCKPNGHLYCCGDLMQAVSVGPGCGCVLRILSARKKAKCPQGHWPA